MDFVCLWILCALYYLLMDIVCLWILCAYGCCVLMDFVCLWILSAYVYYLLMGIDCLWILCAHGYCVLMGIVCLWILPAYGYCVLMFIICLWILCAYGHCLLMDIICLLDGLLGFARIQKRKTNQELKKNVTHLGLEPATSFIAIGYSNYLAIDQKEKLIKNFKKLAVWDSNPRPHAVQAHSLTP